MIVKENYRNKLETIRLKMGLGLISVQEAKEEAAPIIEEMNLKAQEVAKKHNKKLHKFTFVKLLG